MPTKVSELDLAAPIHPIWGTERYDELQVLVRHHGRPVGWISIENRPRGPSLSSERLRTAIVEQLGSKVLAAVLGERISGPEPKAAKLSASVLVCTHDRTFYLQHCLQSLFALDYEDYEVIVIDNAPSDESTAQLAAALPVRYVREGRRGLDWARNRGIAEARNEIVAFVDDDVRVDHQWLQFIARGFAEAEVMAVTGMVAPAELETRAQRLFESAYGGMGHGLDRRVVRRSRISARELLWASGFGVGANMAFRRQVFSEIGTFDVALDVSRPSGGWLGIGAPSGGGGDIEMLHRVVAHGHTLVYEPAALVWHTHRRDLGSLRSTIFDNSSAFGAYLLTCARNHTVGRKAILAFALREWLSWWILRRLVKPGRLSRRMVLLELAGALLSPLTYRAAQRYARQTANASVQDPVPAGTGHG